MATVFIDSESGATGLGIRARLGELPEITDKSVASERRGDPVARREIMAEVDLVVLCLPDDAAKESAAMAASLGNAAPKVLGEPTPACAKRVASQDAETECILCLRRPNRSGDTPPWRCGHRVNPAP